jgi:outer membrane protein
MKKSAFLALLAAGVLAASTASAAQQPWIVKGGLGYLMPKSSVGTVDFGTGKLDVEVDDGWGFVFSVGYMFDEHWALEVLASSPFSHDITIKGAGEAETDLLPPTVSALYYFNPGGRTRPYLGAGINFTEFFNEDPDELHLGGSVGPPPPPGSTSCSPGTGSPRSTCAGFTSTPRSRRTAARRTTATCS